MKKAAQPGCPNPQPAGNSNRSHLPRSQAPSRTGAGKNRLRKRRTRRRRPSLPRTLPAVLRFPRQSARNRHPRMRAREWRRERTPQPPGSGEGWEECC